MEYDGIVNGMIFLVFFRHRFSGLMVMISVSHV